MLRAVFVIMIVYASIPCAILAEELTGGNVVIDTHDGASVTVEAPQERTIGGQAFFGGKIVASKPDTLAHKVGSRIWIAIRDITRIVELESESKSTASKSSATGKQPAASTDDLVSKIEAIGGKVHRLKSLPDQPVIRIDMTDCQDLKDDDLKLLSTLSTVSELYLDGTTVTDEGLKHISGLTNLTYLGLIGASKITDAGMKELVGLQNLEELRIGNTSISDAGLGHLAKLKSLKMVGVIGTPMTVEGLKKFREALPNMHHNREDETEDNRGTVVAQRGGGGQRTDPNFDVSVAKPTYTDQHPSVLFDEAHNNFHTASGRYKVFANLITNDGYQVTPNTQPITAESLSKHKILVSANATSSVRNQKSAFTDEECTAIEKWVKDGGSLLLITDHEPFGSGSEELGKRFGVKMSLEVVVDPANESDRGLLFARDARQIGDHPVMTGRNDSERVNRVLTFTGQSLNGPAGSTQLLKCSNTATLSPSGTSAAGSSQGLALTHGKGRVVVMGEAAQLSAQVFGQPPIPMGMNVPGCDNRQMALNVVHWLSGLLPASSSKSNASKVNE